MRSIAHTYYKYLRMVAFACLFCFFMPLLASAQGAGVSITPAVIEPNEALEPGSTHRYELSITNRSQAEETYFLFTRNIEGVRPGNIPIFAEFNSSPTGYELADWVTLDTNSVTLEPGAETTVGFFVNVPADASPGGHFGGVFVSVQPPQLEESGAAVGYQVANILSLRVAGEVVESATIREFSTDRFVYGSQDVNFTVRIENSGNTLIRPVGPLEIYNMLGSQVGNVVFNESNAGVFPGQENEFSNINWTGDSLGFGRYEAIVSPVYGADGAKQTMSSTVTFWIIPMSIIGPVLAVLAVILLLTYFVARLYIRRSLAAHMGQGRRLVRRRRRGGSSETLLLVIVMLTVFALFLIVLLALFA